MNAAETEAALIRAIDDHVRACGDAGGDELLSSWMVIAHWQKVEADDRSRYTLTFPGSTMPTHVAVGLIEIARWQLIDDADAES